MTTMTTKKTGDSLQLPRLLLMSGAHQEMAYARDGQTRGQSEHDDVGVENGGRAAAVVVVVVLHEGDDDCPDRQSQQAN